MYAFIWSRNEILNQIDCHSFNQNHFKWNGAFQSHLNWFDCVVRCTERLQTDWKLMILFALFSKSMEKGKSERRKERENPTLDSVFRCEKPIKKTQNSIISFEVRKFLLISIFRIYWLACQKPLKITWKLKIFRFVRIRWCCCFCLSLCHRCWFWLKKKNKGIR